jgi:pSer/pThr/pTyr-binding forkhead associated (FHA) protein
MDGVNFVFDGNYLVAEFKDASLIINYQMEMLIHTEVKYLLPVKRQMKNNILYLYYDLTGKISLNRLVSHKKMPDSAYVEFVKSTLSAVTELEEYQLSAEGILLDDNYIFVHPTDYVPHFVYLPIQSKENGIGNVVAYLKNMLVSDIVEIGNSNVMQQTISILNSGDSVHDMLIKLDRAYLGTNAVPVAKESKKSPNRQNYTPVPEKAPVSVPAPKPIPMPVQSNVPQPQKPVANSRGAVPPSIGAKPSKPKLEKNVKNTAPVEGGKPNMNKIRPILMAISVVIIIAFAALLANGVFADEAGNTDYTCLIGLPILLFAANYFAYSKLKVKFITENELENEPKPAKKIIKKPILTQPKKEVAVPATEVKPSASANMGVAKSQAEPINNVPTNIHTVQPVPSTSSMWNFDDSGKTEVLNESESTMPYLQGVQGDIIYIKDQITRIGKLKNQVDVVISNPKVSRVHADIIMHDGKMYVMDLGSANGTYINGYNERINVNTEYELHNNDKVVFANAEYTVRY